MIFIRLCKDSFIRRFGNIGYITNQLTKHDRNYDEIGADFLDAISRVPKQIEKIVEELFVLYKDISREEIFNDFTEFIADLENEKFVVTGYSIEELNKKEPRFSYKLENPKIITDSFFKEEKNEIITDSSAFLYEYFQKNPQIFGLQIEVTSKCNERCIHCYIPNKKKDNGNDINFTLLEKVMLEAKDLKTLSITLSGGELFLHNDIKKILLLARQYDFIISILSNLVLLSDEHITLLKEVNPSIIQVSLYSMNPYEHDDITKIKGSFQKTKNNIEKLVTNDIPVQISCPVMKINYNSYKEVLQYAYSLKTRAHTDFIMMAQADFNTNNLKQRLTLEETKTLINDIVKYDKDYTENNLTQNPISFEIEKIKNLPICGVGIDNICLSSNGDYFPCSGWQGFVLGNAYKQSLYEVWNKSEKIKFLRSLTNSSFPKCLKCTARDYCAMCLVRNFNENNGDLFKVSKHFCDVAFLNKEIAENYKTKNNETT